MAPRGVMLLATPAQRRAIASPLRIELLEAIRHAGRASVSELARLVARPPTALHYHVGVLRRAGLVVVADRRRAGKGAEAVYRTAAPAFGVPARPGPRVSDTNGARTAAAMLRLTQREALRALESPALRAQGPDRNFHLRRLRAPLRPAALARLNAMLDRIERLFLDEFEHAARGASPTPDPIALTIALTARKRATPSPSRIRT